MAVIVGIFKSDGMANQCQTDLNHRGIARTEVESDASAFGGVRLTAYTPDGTAQDVEHIMRTSGATQVFYEQEHTLGDTDDKQNS